MEGGYIFFFAQSNEKKGGGRRKEKEIYRNGEIVRKGVRKRMACSGVFIVMSKVKELGSK
jgi:hypothetical protein